MQRRCVFAIEVDAADPDVNEPMVEAAIALCSASVQIPVSINRRSAFALRKVLIQRQLPDLRRCGHPGCMNSDVSDDATNLGLAHNT